MQNSPPTTQSRHTRLILLIITAGLFTVAIAVIFMVFRLQGTPNYEPAKRLVDNGHIITMDPALGDFKGDILLDGDKIIQVAPEIKPEKGVEIINANNMIVMPGLIDTHRHMWQGVITGAGADLTSGQYFQQILRGLAPKFTPDDVYLGDSLAAYAAIDAGVTTVVDWSHINNTHEHALAAIRALDESKIRAVYAYGKAITTTGLDAVPTLDNLREAKSKTDQNPLLDFAVATFTHELNPANKERFFADIRRARELGVPITMHAGGAVRNPSIVRELHNEGLLAGDMTFVHGNAFTEEDFKMIAQSGAHMSSSPEGEQETTDVPLANMLKAGVEPTVSLDAPTTLPPDLFAQLRTLINRQRFVGYQAAQANGTPLQEVPYTLGESLNYVTTNAAKALGLQDRIGSIQPGKQADIILIRHTDFNTFLGKPRDMVVHANPGNVDTVIIAGRILKRQGNMVNTNADLNSLRERATQANERLLRTE